jgi:hypothetical protein
VDVTIAVATFGAQAWLDRALNETIPAAREHGVPVVHAHGETLAGARNAALAEVRTRGSSTWTPTTRSSPATSTRWRAARRRARARRPLRARRPPRALWQPRVAGHSHDCEAACLRDGNWVVIGACVRTELLRSVGWHDFAWSRTGRLGRCARRRARASS